MLICIENLIDSTMLARLRGWLAAAAFEDGRLTAGDDARKVKLNEQICTDPDRPDPKLEEMQDLVVDAIWDNDVFHRAAQPKEIRSPLFSRYLPGMRYGTHVDSAIMGDMRIDLSMTLFLSDPSDYDGGELVLDFSTGARSIKLPAGSAVLYPTTVLHRVAEVTKGQRLVVVTWIRSMVRDPAARELLFDLETAQDGLSKRVGSAPEIDLLSKIHANLMRRWVED